MLFGIWIFERNDDDAVIRSCNFRLFWLLGSASRQIVPHSHLYLSCHLSFSPTFTLSPLTSRLTPSSPSRSHRSHRRFQIPKLAFVAHSVTSVLDILRLGCCGMAPRRKHSTIFALGVSVRHWLFSASCFMLSAWVLLIFHRSSDVSSLNSSSTLDSGSYICLLLCVSSSVLPHVIFRWMSVVGLVTMTSLWYLSEIGSIAFCLSLSAIRLQLLVRRYVPHRFKDCRSLLPIS